MEPTAEASFAAMRERSKFGMAMAAMIRMIATTISSSINEKPFCLRMKSLSLQHCQGNHNGSRTVRNPQANQQPAERGWDGSYGEGASWDGILVPYRGNVYFQKRGQGP